MGILDSKKRIFDTIITEEGRKQLGVGEFDIKFAAFSDKFAFYEEDVASGSADANARLYMEAESLPQDRITFESDDNGKLKLFEKEGNLGVLGGKLVSGSFENRRTLVTDSAFASLAGLMISGSAENFCKLRIIGSKDQFLDNEDFLLSRNKIEFSIGNEAPIDREEMPSISVDDVESLFQDKRMSHIPNFMFLPPINKPNVQEPDGSPLGHFIPLEQDNYTTFEFRKKKAVRKKAFQKGSRGELSVLRRTLKGREFVDVHFTETSRQNNLFAQFFEIRDKDILKLDVIDFGSFPSKNPAKPDPHIFFVGKVFIDSVGRHTFVNIFTLIFT